jgi:hypothetical protein
MFPAPTRTTAFLAGASLSAIAGGLSILKTHGLVAQDVDSPRLFPFILLYFFVTVVVFVIGVRNLAPREMKTKVPFVYFPTNREAWQLTFEVWRRMALWFLGAATAGGTLALGSYGLQ